MMQPSFKTGYARNASESANPQLWRGLVGAWIPSLGVTGYTLRDVSGHKNDGTLTNMDPSTDWQVNDGRLSLNFDGVNDMIESLDTSSLQVATGDMTVAITMKNLSGTTRTYKYEGLIQKGYYESTQGWEIIRNGSNAAFPFGVAAALYGNQDHYSATPMSATKFQTVVWRKKGLTSNIFLDGLLDSSKTFGAAKPEYSGNLVIGHRHQLAFAPGYFNGPIRSAFLFSTALTDGQILQISRDTLAPIRRRARRIYSVPGPAFQAEWATRSTTIAGVPGGA